MRIQQLLSRILIAICFLAAVLANAPTFAAPAISKPKSDKSSDNSLGEDWVRLSKDKKGKPQALEVAIVRYIPASKVSKKNANYSNAAEYVDLVGAVHVGDRSYYNKLNRLFRSYDALLYELVAPEGTVVERGRGTPNTHPLGAMQNGLKSMLEVEHQLEIVDYTRPNFIHADLTPSEFGKSMADRDESFIQLYFRMAGQAIALQSQQAAKGESSDVDFMKALFSDDRSRMLKIAFAKQFETMESLLTSISGKEGSTLITVRNKRAMDVLREQQKKGKKKIGIFYGAGHLADMHERLINEFKMTPVSVTWLEAWDLRP